jgi:hypothetical protein
MSVCIGLRMLAARVLNQSFLASYWSAGLGRFFQVSALAFHWRADCVLRQRWRKITNSVQRQLLLSLGAIQAASQSTFINEKLYPTPLVISRFNKNRQLILLSLRKLALTAINKPLAL